jgi:hypothetical protein
VASPARETEPAAPRAERTPVAVSPPPPLAAPSEARETRQAPATVAAAAPTDAPEEPVEDLDADLDDGASESYDSLVALVAGLPDEEPSPRSRASATAPTDEEVVEVVDLDDDDGAVAVDRLILKAGAGAPPAEVEEEPEVPVIDLDAEEPAPESRAQAAVPAATGAVAARLAEAAARGGKKEEAVPTFSLDYAGVSTPEARARLLAETLAHAEHKEARYRVPIDTRRVGRWKATAAAAVFVVAGWAAMVPPAWVIPEPPARLDAAARARSIRSALLLQAQQVEAFRLRSQRLPATLEEVTALPGVRYVRSGNRAYQLIAYADGTPIVYDSANPEQVFQELMHTWPPSGGEP